MSYLLGQISRPTYLQMKTEMPDRFFMEGIAEANVFGMSAGLAMEGYIPFVNTIGLLFIGELLSKLQ